MVGKKEVVYELVEELKMMQINIKELVEQLEQIGNRTLPDGLEDIKNECLDMLNSILWVLDGAKYLWAHESKYTNAPAD